MLTKRQKAKQIKEGSEAFKNASILLFADFSGTSVEDLRKLKNSLSEIGAKFKVIKKRLLRIVFEKAGIVFSPERFDAQVGTIFSPRDISETAAPLYRFFKENEKKGFKILGGYDLSAGDFIEDETVRKIGGLPPREVLLGQLVGMLAAPIRILMHILNEKGRKG